MAYFPGMILALRGLGRAARNLIDGISRGDGLSIAVAVVLVAVLGGIIFLKVRENR